MPEILKRAGVYTHLVSDHYHYWEEGGCNYHTRYCSWEISRGQEGDPWKGHIKDPHVPATRDQHDYKSLWPRQDWVNREYMKKPEDQPQGKTFKLGLEFIEKNHREDNWFLTMETFDPHEPFFTQQKYKDLYPHNYDGEHFDWPDYREVSETAEEIEHMRYEYAALVSMCDEQLGKVLDTMDELDLWKDTMLIVNTDHGFLLGEHGWWAKAKMPIYNELAHVPLFIWDPRSARRGESCDSLVQTIDIAPTLLEYFGVDRPKDMLGAPLRDTIAQDAAVRDAALFGIHGREVNCTDGRYVYIRNSAKPDNLPLYEYTLMPTHMRRTFETEELQNIELHEPFSFTKGCRTMKIEGNQRWADHFRFGTLLFDMKNDPKQEHPLQDEAVEQMMIEKMVALMKANDAPAEQYQRLGLKP